MSLIITIVATKIKYLELSLIKLNKFFNSKNIELIKISKLGKMSLDIYIKNNLSDSKEDIAVLSKLLEKYKIDVFIQKNMQTRKKKLIACDMDMTVISLESIDFIAKTFKLEKKIATYTKDTMSGKIAFSDSILKRTSMLKGLKLSKINRAIQNNINFTPGSKTVIKTMKKYGAHTMLISGGYKIVADLTKKKLGFNDSISNVLSLKNGYLDGKLVGTIIDREMKLKLLKQTMRELNIKKNEVMVVGDGANDIDMISYTKMGIAWKAYPEVKKHAKASINNSFISLLYFQGYREEEFSN